MATFFLLGADGNYYKQDGTPVASGNKTDAAVVFNTSGQTKTWENLPWQEYFFEENPITNFITSNDPTAPILIDAQNLTGSRTVTNTYTPPYNPYAITINKTDNTGTIKLSGGVFQIKNSDGVLVTTVTSDTNGYAFVPVALAGTYTIEEITAPDGYSINTNIFTVTLTSSIPTATVNITDDPIITVAGITVAGITPGAIEVLGISELPFTGIDMLIVIAGFVLLMISVIILTVIKGKRSEMRNSKR